MGKTSIALVLALLVVATGLAQTIPAPASIGQATNMVSQDVYMSPARMADFWNDIGIPYVLANGGGTSTTNFDNINVTNTATIGTVQSDNYLNVPGIYYVGGLNFDIIDALGNGILILSGYASLNLNGGNGTVSTENNILDDGSGNSVWPFVGNAAGTTITIGEDPNAGDFPAIYMTDGNGDPFFEVYDGNGGGGSAYMKFIDNSEGLSLAFVGEGILDGNNNHPLFGWDGTTITLGNARQPVVTTDNTLDDGAGNATFGRVMSVFNGNGSGLTNIPSTSITGGMTTNLQFTDTALLRTNTLYFTNGILMRVTSP